MPCTFSQGRSLKPLRPSLVSTASRRAKKARPMQPDAHKLALGEEAAPRQVARPGAVSREGLGRAQPPAGAAEIAPGSTTPAAISQATASLTAANEV